MKYLIILTQLVLFSPLLAQMSDYFIPAGFNNPFLKSGQFVTSLYYFQSAGETSILEDSKTRSAERNINFTGLLGLTDHLTFRTDIAVYPKQTVYEIISGGSGSDKETLNIAPSLTLSYRPINNLEIFGNFDYRNFTRESGEKSRYQDVIVGVDNEGNPVYERQLYSYTSPDYSVKSNSITIGISYLGKFW